MSGADEEKDDERLSVLAPPNTKTPLEAVRDHGVPRITSLTPDVCYVQCGSDKIPVPFNIYAIAGEDARTVPSVRLGGLRAFTMRSFTTTCHGDSPGNALGVVSGTVEGICEPISGSSTVRVEGAQLIRHGDMFHMNNRNTVGKIRYVKDTSTYQTPNLYKTVETKPEREDRCFDECQHLMGIGHGNEYRGCFRRCMGEALDRIIQQ